MGENVLDIQNLSKTYANGFSALKSLSLQIEKGEIFALLGPNGAGKTTLISVVCGLVNPSQGQIQVCGRDLKRDYKEVRKRIGLVPQELHVDMFETVWATLKFSRGLFGKPPNDELLESLLKDLTLWDKRHQRIMTLSGGMKRRVLIAKALAHEPELLFLDEPTAGVDVKLRHDMWTLVSALRDRGVTIVLTTHYIEEAEEMADRVGVISKGELLTVQDKDELLKSMGGKTIRIEMVNNIATLPTSLASMGVSLESDNRELVMNFGANTIQNIGGLFKAIEAEGIAYKDVHMTEKNLEDIFVDMVS